MTTLIESVSTAFILILIVLLVTHLISNSATKWVTSKIKAG